MRKPALLSVLSLVSVIAPAQAGKPAAPDVPTAQAGKPATTKRVKCTPRAVPTSASGTLKAATLKRRGHRRYDGTLKVSVTRANGQAIAATEQTYTLRNVRVTVHRGVNPAAPAPGSRIKVSGTVTVLPSQHCLTATFRPRVTVHKADIAPAKP